MAGKSKIEWTDDTWNPIVGCSVVSPGCTNCYAMKMADRINRMVPFSHYEGTTKRVNDKPVWTGKLVFKDKLLALPLHWKKPRMVFVNSMGDLFHEDVPDEWIDKVFAIMALCPQHTFQVLTKRADRMRTYVNKNLKNGCGLDRQLGNEMRHLLDGARRKGVRFPVFALPLPNVWLGVSAEDQKRAEERIPDLLATPAAVRFVSCEPLLGAIDLTSLVQMEDDESGGTVTGWRINALEGSARDDVNGDLTGEYREAYGDAKLDWVIVGGESGQGARPMHPEWARGLRDQCAEAEVPFFFKQWGEWKDGSDFMPGALAVTTDGRAITPDMQSLSLADRENPVPPAQPTLMRRAGKKKAGRLLDGIEHNGMPQIAGAI